MSSGAQNIAKLASEILKFAMFNAQIAFLTY